MTDLESEIVALDGVLGAQVETIAGAPVSVRLDLAEGTDSAEVAGQVQDVLRRHGLKSRVPGDEIAPAAAEPAESESTSQVERTGPVAAPIAAVSIRQSREGVDVDVEADDGRTESRVTGLHPDEVSKAIADAVASLCGRRPARVVEITSTELGGRTAVTVVLDVGVEDLRVGSAFERGTGELALARAVWSALEG